jgi:hypothetical protein
MNGRDDRLAHLLLALAGEDSNCESRSILNSNVNVDVNKSFSLARPSFCMRGPSCIFVPPPLAFAAGHVKITCLRCRRLAVFPLQISREYENLEIRLNFQASKFHRNFLLPLFLGSSTKRSFCSVLARLGDRRLLVPASQQSAREEVCLPQFTLNLRGSSV